MSAVMNSILRPNVSTGKPSRSTAQLSRRCTIKLVIESDHLPPKVSTNIDILNLASDHSPPKVSTNIDISRFPLHNISTSAPTTTANDSVCASSEDQSRLQAPVSSHDDSINTPEATFLPLTPTIASDVPPPVVVHSTNHQHCTRRDKLVTRFKVRSKVYHGNYRGRRMTSPLATHSGSNDELASLTSKKSDIKCKFVAQNQQCPHAVCRFDHN